ncbi:MAG: sulfatase-like hydrolase/transferase, partial [Promethearchaeota archaeon]
QLLMPNEENLFRLLKKNGYEAIWIGRNDLFHAKSVKHSITKRVNIFTPVFFKLIKKLSIKQILGLLKKILKNVLKKKDILSSLDVLNDLKDYLKMNPYPPDHPLRKSFYFGKRTRIQAELDLDEVIVERALNYLSKRKRKKKKTFCLYLAFNFPHPPYTVEEPFFSLVDRNKIDDLIPPILDDKPAFMKMIYQKYNLNRLKEEDYREIKATYLGMVAKLDSLIGKVICKLEEIDEYDNTVILFFSDHGDYAGDYGLVEKWPTGMQDCLVKVPLIIKIPKISPIKKEFEEFTQSIDIFPTILELAGVETPYTSFAKSLLPLITGATRKHREAIFVEGGYNKREPQCFEDVIGPPENDLIGIYHDKTLLQHEIPETVCRTVMIRNSKWKLVLRADKEAINELYDIENDPREIHNLFYKDNYKDIIDNLKEQLLYWYLNTSDNPHWIHERHP